MSDLEAIAQAIATRFSATNVTPPTGYPAIVDSTEQLPNQIANTPVVLVFPPEETMPGEGSRLLTIHQEWPVRLYLYQRADQPRRMTDLYKWRNSLYLQVMGQTHLGLPTYVAQARVTRIAIVGFEYAKVEYDGIELTVEVSIAEAVTPVA
jgi:hypothetical protein